MSPFCGLFGKTLYLICPLILLYKASAVVSVKKPLSLFKSLTFVGTVISIVLLPVWFTVNESTVALFFWIVIVPLPIVGLFDKSL